MAATIFNHGRPFGMLRKTFYKRKIFCFLFAFIGPVAWSADKTSIVFPHIGRVMLSAAGVGVGASVGAGVGIFGGDVMQPVYGNDNGFLFADFMGGGASDNTFLLSPGVGVRKVVNNQIWGAYFFGDNEKVSLGKNFWNVSPGIEWLTPHWDMHVNGYFPIPQTRAMGRLPVFANTLGNYDYVYFANGTHDQFDALTAPYDVIGNGVDVEMAYRFPGHNNLTSRIYVGGYFYQPASDNRFISIPNIKNVKNITGITAGLQQSLTKNTRIALISNYDTVNFYAIGVRLQLTFGDDSTIYSNNVHDRLLEPIERHVGIIGTGAGTYDQLGYKNLGPALEYNNVYFLSPNGMGNGTYGSPMPLTQTSLDTINTQSPSSSRLYLQGGDPPTYTVNSTNAGANGLALYNRQDLYGRSANYTTPAASGEQPIILVDGSNVNNGFYILSGENSFNDLAITASSTNRTTTGVYVITNTNTTVNVVNTNLTGLNRALYAENDSTTENLTINATNSSFSDNTGSPAPSDLFGAFGIYANNVSTGNLAVNATNSSFNGNTINGGNDGNQAFGIYASNNSAGTVLISAINSSFNGNANSGQDSSGAAGIEAINQGIGNLTINATNSSFSGNTNTGNTSLASGISAYNYGAGTLTINASNSQFNDNSSTVPGANGLYVDATDGNVNLNLNSSSFNGNMTTGENNGSAYGVFLSVQNLNMSVANSTFNGNINDSVSTGGFATGLYAQIAGTGSINVNNSHFNDNQALNGAGL